MWNFPRTNKTRKTPFAPAPIKDAMRFVDAIQSGAWLPARQFGTTSCLSTCSSSKPITAHRFVETFFDSYDPPTVHHLRRENVP